MSLKTVRLHLWAFCCFSDEPGHSFECGLATGEALGSTQKLATLLVWFRFQRLTVPFRVAEVKVRLHEVVDGEVVFSVVKPCTASDDLCITSCSTLSGIPSSRGLVKRAAMTGLWRGSQGILRLPCPADTFTPAKML